MVAPLEIKGNNRTTVDCYLGIVVSGVAFPFDSGQALLGYVVLEECAEFCEPIRDT